MRPSTLCAALLAGLALAGCGGTTTTVGGGPAPGTVPESASFVPPGGLEYFTVNTDFGGAQAGRLEALLRRFPDRGRLLDRLVGELRSQGASWDDVRAALGPEVGVSIGPRDVVLTRPRDSAQLSVLVAGLNRAHPESAVVTRTIDGWTVEGDSKADLDAVERAHAGTSLADDPTFRKLMEELPGDVPAREYIDSTAGDAVLTPTSTPAPTPTVPSGSGGRFQQFPRTYFVLGSGGSGVDSPLAGAGPMAAALTARDDGLVLDQIARPVEPDAGADYAPTLAADVPADALAFVSFDGHSAALPNPATVLGMSLENTNALLSMALMLISGGPTVTPHDLAPLVTGESALYVRPGSPYPEVTVLLTVRDTTSALATLDAVAGRLAAEALTKVEPTTVDGVSASRIVFDRVQVYYAALDGKLVVTNSITGIRGLRDAGPRLADDARFREAVHSARVPDRVGMLAYVDVHDLAPLARDMAALTDNSLPASVAPNLAALGAFVAYATRSGAERRTTTFLAVR